ncbi:hypothetical protein ACFYKX_11510 [Cytobacillus sp. FJAT-54145]|uniref:Uncharacterized protein n=1 Tax=Cytobacillus spartinae TaxID=3299023 RepID=A0ABW6KEA2_9BACI
MKKPVDQLEKGKRYEIKIMGEGTGIYEVRGFWYDERVGIGYVTLWPDGATRAFDCLGDEILSVRPV